jgi:CO dehydrogenase/acetyl-CoA synthase alpha subunit
VRPSARLPQNPHNEVCDNVKFIAIGNKCNLGKGAACGVEDTAAFAQSIAALCSFETSAKTAEGLDALLHGMADEEPRPIRPAR